MRLRNPLGIGALMLILHSAMGPANANGAELPTAGYGKEENGETHLYVGHTDLVTDVRPPDRRGIVPTKSFPAAPVVNSCATNGIGATTGAICTPNLVAIGDPAPSQAEVNARVLDYFRRIDIPRPRPEISAKNGGICGVEHTIDMHMSPELRYRDSSTPFGTLTMNAYAKISVDWGDAKRDTYTTGGGPYPHSAIKHVWTVKGFYDIAATATWTANYSLGPYEGRFYQGTISGVTTTGAIDDFRVWDIQAVLTN
jgi:hypothetical protein